MLDEIDKIKNEYISSGQAEVVWTCADDIWYTLQMILKMEL